MWEIRELSPADIEPVAKVLGLARLGQGDGFYLVAWKGDDPLGHAYLALRDPPELQDVEVRPAHRRRGCRDGARRRCRGVRRTPRM